MLIVDSDTASCFRCWFGEKHFAWLNYTTLCVVCINFAMLFVLSWNTCFNPTAFF